MPCKRFLNYNIQTNAPKSSFGFLRMRALARKQKRDCFERNLFKLAFVFGKNDETPKGTADLQENVIQNESVDLNPSEQSELSVATQVLINHRTEEEAALRSTSEKIESYSTDIALWGEINEKLRLYWLQKNPGLCSNKDKDFSKSARIYQEGDKQKVRTLNKSLFQLKLQNNEIVEREWLSYSPSTGRIYCFVCRLFSSEKDQFTFYGFNDWKHPERITEHEQSKAHKQTLTIYSKRRRETGSLENALTIQQKNEKNYWIQVLRRITDTIKFLASRGLAFRGENERFGSSQNGNYLGILELLSEYDPFLKEHINTYGNKGHGVTSYLSANICEEFIGLMGEKVLACIISELKKAKYYSFSVDSTPDITHLDQLTFTVRYVTDQGPIERFLMFVPIEGHNAEYLTEVVVKFFKDNDIDINDCRGQSYDNASNMSGRYSGLQTRIREINKYADYIPCAGHSLNLVGVKAAECVNAVVKNEKKVVKSLSATRWSARADAIIALFTGHTDITKALDDLSKDDTQSNETRLEAKTILKQITKFENVFITVVWHEILTRINDTSKNLQKENMDLYIACSLLNSLELYLLDIRDKFDEFLEKAKSFTDICESESTSEPRNRRRSVKLTRFEGESEHTQFTGDEKLKIEIFYPIIDSLCSNLKTRKTAYETVNDNFKFFTALPNMTYEGIKECCEKLARKYDQDISAENLISECLHYKHYLRDTRKNEELFIPDLYLQLKKEFLTSTFPNIEISLRIFLTLMITNCAGERSFSRLKLIKSDHRSTMSQSRLNHLSLMSIESDLLKSIDFDELISNFAAKKSRKKVF
ncbi:unnamed protein product [Parnassius apollo]|uniref:(apollo) hypothetical protein n=1 Tax=Parnassius apollo TaxID=110799 RepID=A0A8S3WIY7_PARAO|nr:unnamed protein product [Parnassius apollo]CAG5059925.1 unnamed protein product [Parnassius apollo]